MEREQGVGAPSLVIVDLLVVLSLLYDNAIFAMMVVAVAMQRARTSKDAAELLRRSYEKKILEI